MKVSADTLATQILREASRFVGLREVRKNSDWDNPKTPERDYALAEELRKLMRPSPWEEGWAYCYTGDIEVLSESGWLPFSDSRRIFEQGVRVVQVNSRNEASLTQPIGFVEKTHVGHLVRIKHKGMDVTTDPEHRFWGSWQRSDLDLRPIRTLTSELRIPPIASYREDNSAFTDLDLEFAAAYIADGYRHTHHGKPVCEFRVSMPRKMAILESWNPSSTSTDNKTYHPDTKTPLTKFRFDRPIRFDQIFADEDEYKSIRWPWALSLSSRQARVFLNACTEWSGEIRCHSAQIRTAREGHANVFLALAALGGYQAKLTKTINKSGYNVGGSLWHVRYADREGRNKMVRGQNVSIIETNGTDLFCLQVPEGRLLIRDRSGSTYICGNCAAYTEGVVAAALRSLEFPETKIQRWHKVMTPHCVTSAGNFRARKLLTDQPDRGAIWLARHGSTSNGHAGIVSAASGKSMATIEANTSLDPTTPAKDREGDWITTRVRSIGGTGSLKTMGFVTPASILALLEA